MTMSELADLGQRIANDPTLPQDIRDTGAELTELALGESAWQNHRLTVTGASA